MKTFNVGCTLIYNGNMTVEAKNGEEAVKKAQKLLDSRIADDFPDGGNFGKAHFTFGEATADYIDD